MKKTLTLILFGFIVSHAAFAQTALGPNGQVVTSAQGSQNLQNQPLPPVPGARPNIPVSQGRVDQAKRQLDGEFDHLSRPDQNGVWVGGQIQEAWSDSIKTEGVFVYDQCDECTYKVRTREHMVSSVILPRSVKIHTFDVGDAANFEVKKRADNIITVLPKRFGVDTSVLIYGTDGSVWPFYLRAEGTNSLNIPDLKVIIKGDPTLEEKPVLKTANDQTLQSLDLTPEIVLSGLQDKVTGETKPEPDDFIRSVAVDPDKFHGWANYELYGSDNAIRPKAVFRDDYFTYIQFGDDWDTSLELPTAYVVVDEIDEAVNTRISGRTFIVESTRDLITLKSGQSYLCIQYNERG